MSESADLLYNVLVLIVACNDLALDAEPCADEPELAVAVRRLVEVHEVHVDAVVGELLVELRVQMEHWLFQGFQRSYPHLGRRECVHPHDNAYALLVGGGAHADVLGFVSGLYHRLEYDFCDVRELFIQKISHLSAVLSGLRKGFLTIQILASGNKVYLVHNNSPSQKSRTELIFSAACVMPFSCSFWKEPRSG